MTAKKKTSRAKVVKPLEAKVVKPLVTAASLTAKVEALRERLKKGEVLKAVVRAAEAELAAFRSK